MFGIKGKQKNTQIHMVIALTFLCLLVCAVNVQFYMEHQIIVRIVTHPTAYTNALNQQEDYFNMSLSELMEVVVVSKSDTQPSSCLLNSHCFSDGAQELS
ncbi:MAG: hypothetical protein PHY02_08885 [Phycisphaerae bacterium]|nr:hypothetical protein [Phycisphaerae bacterium]